MTLDVDFVRSHYAVFQRPATAAWAFFENAGGSYVPETVLERLDAFFRWYKVQPYGPFESSAIAGEAMDAGYRCIAELLNAADDEITIGPSTSLNCYVLAQAFRPQLKPGDEVVVTNQDHEANIGCWERLSDAGAVIRRWQIDPESGELCASTNWRNWSRLARASFVSACVRISSAHFRTRGRSPTLPIASGRSQWPMECPTRRTGSSMSTSWEPMCMSTARTRPSARIWESCGSDLKSKSASRARDTTSIEPVPVIG